MEEIEGDTCFQVLDRQEYIFFYFSASWCKPCQKISPLLNKLSQIYNPNDIRFYKIDIDNELNKEISNKCQIKVIPAFLIFKNRKFIGRTKGGKIERIQELLDNALPKIEEVEEEVEEEPPQMDHQPQPQMDHQPQPQQPMNPFLANKQLFNKKNIN